MKGNTINEFMSDLRYNGGPEKEFVHGDRYYLVQAAGKEGDDKDYLTLDEFVREGDDCGEYLTTYWFGGKTLTEAVEEFEKAGIFDGKTIYEVEKDIEVLFG